MCIGLGGGKFWLPLICKIYLDKCLQNCSLKYCGYLHCKWVEEKKEEEKVKSSVSVDMFRGLIVEGHQQA